MHVNTTVTQVARACRQLLWTYLHADRFLPLSSASILTVTSSQWILHGMWISIGSTRRAADCKLNVHSCDWLLEVLPLVLVCLCYRLKEPLDLPWCLFSIKSPNSPFRPAAAKTTERPRSRQRSSWKTKSAKDVCKAAPVEFAATSGARDQNSHGSVGITLLSHGSDQFSDQQKKKKDKNWRYQQIAFRDVWL